MFCCFRMASFVTLGSKVIHGLAEMRWGRFLKIVALVLIAAALGLGALLGPQFWNMKSEYMTAGAIHDLEAYAQEHAGKWPTLPADLGDEDRKGVWIDYSMTSDRILATPELLRASVRPESGKFYTYPRYDEDLESLLEAIRKANTGATESPVGRKDIPDE